MVTNAGGGYSHWHDLSVTRWREDATLDNWGSFIYLRDMETERYWSAAHQPTLRQADRYEAVFTQARAEYRRRDQAIETHTEISVSPETLSYDSVTLKDFVTGADSTCATTNGKPATTLLELAKTAGPAVEHARGIERL